MLQAFAQAGGVFQHLAGGGGIAGLERIAQAEFEPVDAELVVSSSIIASWAMAPCGTPKPRNAPAGWQWVKNPRPRVRTLGTAYGPDAWMGTRVATVGPQLA